MTLVIRRMRSGEQTRLYEVLRDAVLRGAAQHYDEAQRNAWAPPDPFEGWFERLAAAECFVASIGDRIVGFVSATRDGHLDLAYVLSDLKGAGIGGLLLDRIERELRLDGVAEIRTEASLVSEPFFRRRGWIAGETETVVRLGQKLRRVRMRKRLAVDVQAESQAS